LSNQPGGVQQPQSVGSDTPTRSEIDLHTHTTASDGLLSPTALVELASARGLRILGITDHDSTGGVEEALQAAAEQNVEVWPGVEISTDVPGAEVHLLGYFVDLHDNTFQRTLRALRDGRRDRAHRMVERLAQLGIPVEWSRVVELAGTGAIGRPHVAQAMVEKGYVRSVTEAFDLYLGRKGPAYIERYKLTPDQAAELVRQAGGLPVLAHPVIVGAEISGAEAATEPRLPPHIEQALPGLIRHGLVGIEAYYPDYPAALTDFLLDLAAQQGLVATGGSDFHGGGLSADLGSVYVPWEAVEGLRRLRTYRGTT